MEVPDVGNVIAMDRDARGNFGPGEWCLGHGLIGQAESLRTGHYVEAHLVGDVLGTHKIGTKGLGTVQPRCRICRSIRQWHDHHANAWRRAGAWRRQHAKRWVQLRRHLTIEAALLEMDVGGVTQAAVTEIILAAIGEPCPGLCAHEQDGEMVFHTIDRVADCHIDVRDPNAPFSIENLGPLCISCNPAKGDMAWHQFIYRRRAALRAWWDAINRSDYRRPEQLGFDL